MRDRPNWCASSVRLALCFWVVCSIAPAQWIDVEIHGVAGTFALGGITLGPDGALWFTKLNGQIGRITTGGVITEFPASGFSIGPTAPQGIVAGPDGALWVAGARSPLNPGNPGSITRVTTSGGMTVFTLANSETFAQRIAAGPDGNLWFTERNPAGGSIGRITTAGVITEYPPPSNCGGNCNPEGIAAGPDGALWFTERDGNRIGRITTAGVISEFPLPNPGSVPYLITSGPDGALWFTEIGASRIGRITTAGVITEFPVQGVTDGGITSGPDGALWFVTSETLGRITTSGVVTQYPNPPHVGGTPGITAGPDGALWYTLGVYFDRFTFVNSRIARSPACGLGLRANFQNGTLTANFTLGTTTAATFDAGYLTTSALTPFWSIPIPAVVPPTFIAVNLGQGFSNLGQIGVLAALKNPTTQAFLCADWRIVDTGGAGPSAELVRRRIETSLPRP